MNACLRASLSVSLLLSAACSSSSASQALHDSGTPDAGHPSHVDAGHDALAPKHDSGGPDVTETKPPHEAGTSDSPTASDASDAATDVPFDASPFTPIDGGDAIITGLTPQAWTWVPFPQSLCRDGSSTGIGINTYPGATKLVLFLEGGGACFNSLTCSENPSSFNGTDFAGWFASASDGGAPEPGHGILDRDPANPVQDWNYVYVPYCTGDIHAGSNPAGTVPGVDGGQAFMGYVNMDLYLQRLVPTFSSATQILLTGVSGGGFGAAANYLHVQRKFGSIPVSLIDDSGPFMENPYLATCLQDETRTLWGLNATVGADCAGSCNDPATLFLDFIKKAVGQNPTVPFGLMDSTDDEVITAFFGFGENDCQTTFAIESEATFTAGLDDIRTNLASDSNFGSFIFPGTDHTSLEEAQYYTRTAGDGGTPLTTWVGALVGGSTSNVGP
jgi:Pectinacetylesterase